MKRALDTYSKLTELSILPIAQDLLPGVLHKQKIGDNYRGLCPFHKENRPSFYINIERNFFICYGCHEYGKAIDLIYKIKEDDAVKYVNDRFEFSTGPIDMESLEFLLGWDEL